MKQILLLVAKRPAPGQTKTRLSPPLSAGDAARLYECFLRDSLDLARAVPQVDRRIVYWPSDERDYFARLAPDFDLALQEGAALGERLEHALAAGLRQGYDRAVVMDTDSPSLPHPYIAQAFSALARADVTLGPCDDGGYYLIGVKQPQPRLLREVQMSTPNVMRDTLALAAELKLQVELLPEWYDVDTRETLERLEGEAGTAANGQMRHTREFLRDRGRR